MMYEAKDTGSIPETVKKLWNEWDIRLFVISSLFLQILLIFLAPIRKRKLSRYLSPLIWAFYLLADWVATFSLGLLSDSQNADSDCTTIVQKIMRSTKASQNLSNTNKELQAFWAPFLLLHLGGPDTITAFALEDNELWLRHLLGLLFEVAMAGYVISRAFPMKRLLIPTLLMFFAGTVKYGERTRALFLASMDGFRDSMLGKPDPGPNYAKLMNELTSKKEAGVPAKIDTKKEEDDTTITIEDDNSTSIGPAITLSNILVIEKAQYFFNTFKGLIANLIFSFRDRDESQNFFKKLSAVDAFRVVEAELNFIYEVLYTKGAVVHTFAAHVLRGVCSCSILTSLLLFVFAKKPNYDKVDVGITYALLGGAVILDIVAVLMLVLSDKTLIAIFTRYVQSGEDKSTSTSITTQLNYNSNSVVSKVLNQILSLKNPRWSESMSQYNLIDFCLARRPASVNWTLGKIGVRDYADHFFYTSCITVDTSLKNFVFSELMKKSRSANDSKSVKMMCSYRGSWALEERGYRNLLGWSVGVEFDESLLLWHIATDICYNKSKDEEDGSCPWVNEEIKNMKNPPIESKSDSRVNEGMENQENPSIEGNSNSGAVEEGKDHEKNSDTYKEMSNKSSDTPPPDHREMSKNLSDYMLYLLVVQPSMMSSMAGIGLIRYRDTCAEAKIFFPRKPKSSERTEWLRKARRMLLEVNTEVDPIDVKGDRSKSVLFDAVKLAKDLDKLPNTRRWKIIAEVWVELLSYAASHCRGSAHAARLSKGGELLMFVWFLMAHLGLGEQFCIEAGHARAKLIVEK